MVWGLPAHSPRTVVLTVSQSTLRMSIFHGSVQATSEFENETRSGLSRRSSRTRTADEKPQSDEAAEVSSPEPIGSTKEGRGGNAVSVASNEKNKPEADERTEEMKSPAAKKLRGNIDVSLAGSSSRKTIQSENSSGSANKKGRDKLMRTPKGSDDDKDDDYDPRKNEKGSKKKKRIKRLISTKGEVSSSTSEDVDNSDADEPATGKGMNSQKWHLQKYSEPRFIPDINCIVILQLMWDRCKQ